MGWVHCQSLEVGLASGSPDYYITDCTTVCITTRIITCGDGLGDDHTVFARRVTRMAKCGRRQIPGCSKGFAIDVQQFAQQSLPLACHYVATCHVVVLHTYRCAAADGR